MCTLNIDNHKNGEIYNTFFCLALIGTYLYYDALSYVNITCLPHGTLMIVMTAMTHDAKGKKIHLWINILRIL